MYADRDFSAAESGPVRQRSREKRFLWKCATKLLAAVRDERGKMMMHVKTFVPVVNCRDVSVGVSVGSSWLALRLCEPVRLSARLTDLLSRRLRAAFLLASSLFVAAQG